MTTPQQTGLNIRVHEFFQKAEPIKDDKGKETGEIIVRDYVKYGPPLALDRQAIIARVERILKAPKPDSENPAMIAAYMRREYIEPLYLAWKRGEELPENGTPLAACNFLRAEDVTMLKRAGIRSVQELSQVLDKDLATIRVPMMREKREQAIVYLKALDTNKIAAEMAARDATVKEQGAELAELKAQLAALMGAKDQDVAEVDENGDRVPKRRGRPPNASRETEAA